MRRFFASRTSALATLSALLAFFAAELAPTSARADDTTAWPCNTDPFFCASAGVTFDRKDALPIEWSLDTGWVPQNSPLSVRIQSGVYAHTHVTLGGSLMTTWPEALHLEAPGAMEGSAIDFHYGAEFIAQGMVNITIAGVTYKWTGDIPFVPKLDFQVEAGAPFGAWAYAPGVELADKTLPQKVAQVGVGDLIGASIPGIDGGFELDVAMELSARYTTERMVIATAGGEAASGGPITKADGASSTAYGGEGSIDLDVHPEGRVDYDGVLHAIPAFYVSLLGKNFKIPIVDVPVAFPITKTPWVFDPERVHVPLPRLSVSKKSIDLGMVELGKEVRLPFELESTGEARVQAVITSSQPKGVVPEDASLLIDPGKMMGSAIRVVPSEPGAFTAEVIVASNDPNNPVQIIELTGQTTSGPSGPGDEPEPTPPITEDGGCACRAAGQAGGGAPFGPVAALAISSLALHSRRRRRV